MSNINTSVCIYLWWGVIIFHLLSVNNINMQDEYAFLYLIPYNNFSVERLSHDFMSNNKCESLSKTARESLVWTTLEKPKK